jgi:formylglycine-generating enzyme required for sulfatase activity/uncharacterized caspase-like protein
MIKKGLFLVFFLVGAIMTPCLPQEDTKGVRINRLANNAGKRWAICIGINDYEDKSIIDLKKARNDASELGKVLKAFGQFERVYVMTDDQDPKGEDYPKLINIKRKLDYLKEFIDPADLVLFSFSGHGIANAANEGFLLMADSYREDFYGSSLKVKDIIQWLKNLGVKKSLLLLDACREHFQDGRAVNLNGLKAERFLRAEVGAVFYATKAGWYSYEDAKGNFGVFTRCVIDGLIGRADGNRTGGNGDGIVTFSELAAYVEEEVSNWALDESKQQKPYTMILGEKYGDLALSAYLNTGGEIKRWDETGQDEKPDDKPAEVKAVEAKGIKVNKDDKGYWEADYGEGIVMVYIPAGDFPMGSNDGDDDEKPMHNVYLDGYWLGKTEVTVRQFRAFVNETKYETEAEKYKDKENWENPGFNQEDNHPVVYVSWNDAVAYCKWLSKTKGITFTLPTEARWEKGARGTDGRKYPWGNHEPYENGKYYANYNPGQFDEDGCHYTAPVGSYPQGASPYGLLDMAGNVCEWVNDWHDARYYESSPPKNPTGPVNGSYRVLRGGSWFDLGRLCRSALRNRLEPANRYVDSGLRLSQGQE